MYVCCVGAELICFWCVGLNVCCCLGLALCLCVVCCRCVVFVVVGGVGRLPCLCVLWLLRVVRVSCLVVFVIVFCVCD